MSDCGPPMSTSDAPNTTPAAQAGAELKRLGLDLLPLMASRPASADAMNVRLEIAAVVVTHLTTILDALHAYDREEEE